MRQSVSSFAALAVAAMGLCALPPAQGQVTASPTTENAPYVAINPLSGVRYDNRYDLSLSMAYDHMKAGPSLLQGSNLGGLNLSGSYWLLKHWGLEGSGRYYLGTSGAAPNPDNINGPFVSQFLFVGGPEWLGPHNEHGDLIAHVMFGGVDGKFQQDLRGTPPYVVGFYNDQMAPAAIIGGHMDLNRSARWVFRITPDAVMTHYYSTDINGKRSNQFDVNFAISVGVEYKFRRKR